MYYYHYLIEINLRRRPLIMTQRTLPAGCKLFRGRGLDNVVIGLVGRRIVSIVFTVLGRCRCWRVIELAAVRARVIYISCCVTGTYTTVIDSANNRVIIIDNDVIETIVCCDIVIVVIVIIAVVIVVVVVICGVVVIIVITVDCFLCGLDFEVFKLFLQTMNFGLSQGRSLKQREKSKCQFNYLNFK